MGLSLTERFKEAVVDPIDERCIKVREEHGGILEHDFEGLDDGIEHDSARRKIPLFDLRGGLDVRIGKDLT